ncbi:unnamed protein product [Paramecium sonneborni]|uniref:WD40-repeat-containing domain n=1 Tax=Paramecium sonneborni TaxID=65129 RepID=A0A8S1R088_9CILI|nr:unnamed protein product [Paramecium sonneborni]
MNITKNQQNPILKSQNYIREALYSLIFMETGFVMAAGLEKFLIYSLRNGYLKFLGQVTQNDIIFSQCEIKCSNQILQGNIDGEIKIWHHTSLNHSKYIMKLKKHNSRVSNIIINREENQIYSCSTALIIIYKQQQYKYSENILQNDTSIRCISLNESLNKQIACGLDKQIIILQQDPLDLKWKKMQKIGIKTNGERLCFINGNQFVFQQYLQNKMLVFEFNDDNKQFQKKNEVIVGKGVSKCDFGFQMQFSKEKQIIINKNTSFVNIIKVKQNNQYILVSQINFDTPSIFGSLSDDGRYLITWDKNSKCIQLREINDFIQ